MFKTSLTALLCSLLTAAIQPTLADERPAKPQPSAEAEAAERTRDEEAAEKKRRMTEERSQDKRREQERRGEELGRMKQELVALREKAQHPETPEEARGELKREIQQLEMRLKQGVGEQPPVKKGQPKPGAKPELPPELREHAERLEMAGRRIKHVRIAAENLMAAEMPDIAHELLQRAEGMEREVAAAKEELMRRMHGQHGGPKPGPPKEAEALRNENRKLQNELRELRGLVEKLQTEGGR